MSGMSIATIKSPEFINITSISPLISKCEVKVCYVGENRNRSIIDKEVAAEMAKTLPGTPIVGYYSESEEDFRDHGEQIIVDGDGIKFNCLTKPYGFVPPESKIWFKEFEDTDEFGNKELRDYLMCEGYLWTEQYKEAQAVINEGRPHSMELEETSLKGHWSKDNNRGIEFFIINDAIFSKLCILGEDVEPCFEGSSVTRPDISASFTKDNQQFVRTLHTMMEELKELTYSLKEGGNSMTDENKAVENQPEPKKEFTNAEGASQENTPAEPETTSEEKFSKSEDKNGLDNKAENQNNTEKFKKDDKEGKDNKEEGGSSDNDSSDNSRSNSDDETGNGNKENEEDDEKKKAKNTLNEQYTLLQYQFNELQEKYNSLEKQNKELVEFKKNVEDKEKDELIKSFYMLSDEDKKDIIENKSKFTLDEIEKELSVICVRKKVSFDLKEENKQEESPAVTFNMKGAGDDNLPAWLKAVENHKNENN